MQADDPFDLSGRVAIVTGGGTGIGAETVRLLAAHGADIALASRNLQNLERVAREVSAATGRRCLPIATDVKEEDEVVRMVERTVAELGRIDILVNNAGGTRLGPLASTPTQAWDNSLALNLRGPFLCTREAGRQMLKQRRGVIVNISSGAGLSGVKGGAAYAAAKSGLQMLTRVVAAEWGPHGIRANCIAVGLVASERAVEAWKRAPLDREAMISRIPLRRVGLPRDIAYPILFLASEASAFMSGQTFAVDGGPTMEGIPDEPLLG
jgi:NAD(P)-dependent dehydrogenase (short-subunit alcohol dehydrogenase family)